MLESCFATVTGNRFGFGLIVVLKLSWNENERWRLFEVGMKDNTLALLCTVLFLHGYNAESLIG